MNNITKVSEITVDDVAEYLHISEIDEADEYALETLMGVATAYIKSYTGQDDLDSYQDFVIAVFILVQDMWDNRTMYVDNTNLNYVVETILGMHCVNLLPTEDE